MVDFLFNHNGAFADDVYIVPVQNGDRAGRATHGFKCVIYYDYVWKGLTDFVRRLQCWLTRYIGGCCRQTMPVNYATQFHKGSIIRHTYPAKHHGISPRHRHTNGQCTRPVFLCQFECARGVFRHIRFDVFQTVRHDD